jgi:hypothetical protein
MDIRYQKLIQYKSALDNSFRKSCITEIYNNDYSSTLQQAKLDGYKVMRNSKGEHKLIDTIESGKSSTIEKFNELFGGLF